VNRRKKNDGYEAENMLRECKNVNFRGKFFTRKTGIMTV